MILKFNIDFFIDVPDDFSANGTEYLSVPQGEFRVIQGSTGRFTDDTCTLYQTTNSCKVPDEEEVKDVLAKIDFNPIKKFKEIFSLK